MQAIERSLAFHFLWLRPVENESTRVERRPNLALPFRGALPLLWTFVWTRRWLSPFQQEVPQWVRDYRTQQDANDSQREPCAPICSQNFKEDGA